ncbi:MAG: sulfite exporter TauE/SafE family protein [Solirubrobacteraceae bacterium]
MTVAYALLLVATFAGVAVQSSVGFGFSFFVAPLAAGVLAPEEAVMLLLLLGVVINLLVLCGERRRPEADWRVVAVMLAASVPTLVLGALVVRSMSAPRLQILIGVAIVVAVLLQRAERPAAGSTSRARLPVAGLAAGVLTTSTSLNGPAVVIGVLSRPLRRDGVRDSIALTFLGLSVLGSLTLVLLVGQERSVPSAGLIVATLPFVLVGHRVGRAVFRRLDDDQHRRWIIIAALVAGAGSTGAGLLSL